MVNVAKVAGTVLLLMSGLGAFVVSAAEDGQLARILEQQRALRADIDSGKSGLSARQVRLVRQEQDKVFALVADKASLEQLNVREQIELENALERINANVVGTRVAQESQDVCWNEAPTGSKVKVTRCGTVEEREEARRGARAFMEKPRICVPPGCGS